LNKLFIGKGGKFNFSAQEIDLAFFVDNATEVKKPAESIPPLA
jgi:hypothetical protein